MACDEAEHDFAASGESHLIPQTGYWRVRLERLRRRFRELDGGIIGELATHARAGRIELLSSAATHGFLPLLRRSESMRLQLATGHAEHRRLFGLDPAGLLASGVRLSPRPRGPDRRGGIPLLLRGLPHGAGGPLAQPLRRATIPRAAGACRPRRSSIAITRAARIRPTGSAPRATCRPSCATPESTLRVWSRHQGYPGDGGYLEFHKIRWPGGLKLWRVTRRRRRARRQGAVRRQRRAGAGAQTRGGLRIAPRQDRPDGAARRRRGHRDPVRHRALRSLVVRGGGFHRRPLSGSGGARLGASGDGVANTWTD